MPRLTLAVLAASLAFCAAFLVSSASATPVFVNYAEPAGNGVQVGVHVRPQGGTRCKVNLFTVVYDIGTGGRVARLGRQSVDGCAEEDYSVIVPASLASGRRYAVCILAVNNNNYGKGIRHTSCRRFRG